MNKCAICGWDLKRPNRGMIADATVVTITVGPLKQDASVHASCLLRDGVSLAGRISTLIGLQDEEEALTPEGRSILERERYA